MLLFLFVAGRELDDFSIFGRASYSSVAVLTARLARHPGPFDFAQGRLHLLLHGLILSVEAIAAFALKRDGFGYLQECAGSM